LISCRRSRRATLSSSSLVVRDLKGV
jgi:hypothetical protein